MLTPTFGASKDHNSDGSSLGKKAEDMLRKTRWQGADIHMGSPTTCSPTAGYDVEGAH